MTLIFVFLYAASIQLLTTEATGSGRAFPVEAEQYTSRRFSSSNPSIVGSYANCELARSLPRIFYPRESTPEFGTITGLVGWTDGAGVDAWTVTAYIKTIVNNWLQSSSYTRVVKAGRIFGCSVSPGCENKASVICLFSPGGTRDVQLQNDQASDAIRTGGSVNVGLHSDASGTALAFTPEQYDLAEEYMGNKWDRAHYLENLSGQETNCAMIGNDNWPFSKMRQNQKDTGLKLTAMYGHTENLGNTQHAIMKILSTFKQQEKPHEVLEPPDGLLRACDYLKVVV